MCTARLMTVSCCIPCISRGGVSQTPSPPVDKQTPVKTLPCPKRRLRTVIKYNDVNIQYRSKTTMQDIYNTVLFD